MFDFQKKIRQPDLRDGTQNISDFAMCKLQEEVVDAINYKVQVHEPGHSWKVTRKAIETETFHIVSMNENDLRCNCLKTVQNGWACQHITASLLFQGLSVFTGTSFNVRWARRLSHDASCATLYCLCN